MTSCAAPALTLVLLAQFAPLAPTSAPLLGDGSTTAPAVEGQPIEVAIGFYALDFARVTSRDESFDLTGYLELSWRDPRLALCASDKAKSNTWRRLDPARIWTPRVYFENALEQPRGMLTRGRGLRSAGPPGGAGSPRCGQRGRRLSQGPQ